MSAADRAKQLKEKFGGLGAPRARDEIKGALGDAFARGRPGRKRKAEKMAQLNLRVSEELKHRLRILATRDRREMSDIVIEAIALYEARFGAAPVLEPKRQGLRGHRSAAELKAAINAALLRPVESSQRIRGAVGELSNNCHRADSRTAESCAEIGRLREELAAANEERDLDRRLSELTIQAHALRERGAMKAADPQGR